MIFDKFLEEVKQGRDGKVNFLPIGMKKLGDHIKIYPGSYTILGGFPGCLAEGTKVMRFSGVLSPVENIKVGDNLMGIDGKPRTVLSTTQGVAQMYKIKQSKGDDYVVNEDHILSLLDKTTNKITNIPLLEYLTLSKNKKSKLRGYKKSVKFTHRNVPLSPYYVGIWLGDGSSRSTAITTEDREVVDELLRLAKEYDIRLNVHFQKGNANNYYLAKIKGKNNPILDKLRKLNLIQNKHIPSNYLFNSESVRLQVLAGLLDSDGYYSEKNNNFEIKQTNEKLSRDIAQLSRSLGFFTSIKKFTATLRRNGYPDYKTPAYRIYISGDLNRIPTRIPRKQAKESKPHHLTSTIKVEKMSVDKYYGFTISGDNLFYLEDCTITHNSGKTAFLDQSYVLYPFFWWKANKDNTNTKVKWLYYSMERKLTDKINKWVCWSIYKKTKGKVLVDVQTLKGLRKTRVSDEIFKMIVEQRDNMEELLDHILMREGSLNPTGIYKDVVEFASENGKIVTKEIKHKDGTTYKKKEYKPNDPNLIVIIAVDHIGKVKGETHVENGKATYMPAESRQLIQKLSDYAGSTFRDFYNFSPVFVIQLNRNLENAARFGKAQNLVPSPSDFKNASNPYEDADMALVLYNPYKVRDLNWAGYKITKFINPNTGANRFRGIIPLKNSYGIDDGAYGSLFFGENGVIQSLDKPDNLTNSDYLKYSRL